eukprot:s90_g3.t1
MSTYQFICTHVKSFLLNDVLVTGSTACEAQGDARISQLLRDLLLWEGDANTVLVMGSLEDLQKGDPEDFWAVAECAANMYDFHLHQADDDERALREAEDQAASKQDPKEFLVEKFGHLMLNSRFRQRPAELTSGLGDQMPRRSRATSGAQTWPYCRLGSWLAASVGAFNEMTG